VLHFTLRQLEYFVAIAESDTLAAAAERLLVSQSTLSQSLSELESAVGSQLCIRRRSRGVTLTPSGRETLVRARDVLRRASDIQWNIGGSDELRGPLAVGCYISLAPRIIPALLGSFGEKYPHVDVAFSERTQDALQDELLEGVIDVALLFDMELRPGLIGRELATFRPHIIVHADHPLAGRGHVRLHELADEPMVLLDSHPSAENTRATYRSVGIEPRVAYEARSFETARSLVGGGFGYAFLVQRLADSLTYDGGHVARLEIDDDIPPARLMLLTSARAGMNDRARAFADHCQAHFAGERAS
jgi:DNA-binding transcriptional LysR family regulator